MATLPAKPREQTSGGTSSRDSDKSKELRIPAPGSPKQHHQTAHAVTEPDPPGNCSCSLPQILFPAQELLTSPDDNSQDKPGSTVPWEGEEGVPLRKSPRAIKETTLCVLEQAPLPR